VQIITTLVLWMMQLPQPNSQSVLYGQLAVLGMLVIVVGTLFAFTEKRVTRIVDQRMNEPDSALSRHKDDADAHWKMRELMVGKLDERLAAIQQSIADARREAHQDFSTFQRDVVQPILKQNERTLELLSKTMDRERRFATEIDS